MRRFVLLTTIVAAVLAPLPASATTGETPIQLTLGDSVAFGIGADRPEIHGYTVVLNRWATGVDCREDDRGGCPNLDLVNLAVPGATSTSLIGNQLGAAVQLLGDRNHDLDPANDVELINMTIGGNDLFSPVVAACSGGVTPECIGVVEGALTTYAANLGVILGTLRAAAGPETEIVIMTYYNPLGACHLSNLAPLADLVLEGGGPVPVGINGIIRATAAATGARVADTFGELDGNDFVGGQDCLHPDKSGHHRIARIFERTIRG
jgi:lysophospholipase L1-like esterase